MKCVQAARGPRLGKYSGVRGNRETFSLAETRRRRGEENELFREYAGCVDAAQTCGAPAKTLRALCDLRGLKFSLRLCGSA